MSGQALASIVVTIGLIIIAYEIYKVHKADKKAKDKQ